ncbi:MAG: GspE/PulE family protein [Acidimicrobiales bacterium]
MSSPVTSETAEQPAEQSGLGGILQANGVLAPEDLAAAEQAAQASGKSLGRVLLEQGAATEADLVAALAQYLGLDFVDLTEYPVAKDAVGIVPAALSRRYQALPIGFDGDRLIVAMADPSNVFALDDIRTISHCEVKVVVATKSAIEAAIAASHRVEGDASEISARAAREASGEEKAPKLFEATEDSPIAKLVNLVISQAVVDRASDIHIEPEVSDVRIRYRIDGVLHEAMRVQRNIHAGMVSRLKIMADLDIADRRLPQDGRMSLQVAGKTVDLRMATLPTVHGEKVVMRILDKSAALLKLADLGFLPQAMAQYEQSYRKPYGTVLVTGPTGSGKSTTLYATLNLLNQESKNVITVEDPVEYRLPGINQVQVNSKAGLTFAVSLRSILRSDPDIVLVGEIRDRETATIAIEAALTGHLVLSTLHTNDAASTPTRLVEMGIEPYLAASALDCIVAQRLARKLCVRCKKAYLPTAQELSAISFDLESFGMEEAGELPEIFRSVGCRACGKTGYAGRFSIQEVLTVTEEVERMIVEREHSEDVKKMAVAQGMVPLRQTGLEQVMRGVTSIEEVLRVVA